MRRDTGYQLGSMIYIAGLLFAQLITLSAGRQDLPWSIAIWLVLALIIAAFAHQIAHALAVRAVGERVLGIEVGGLGTLARFNLGSVPVTLNWLMFYGGRVIFHGRQLSVARQTVIAAAGPAANALLAACCALLPVPPWEKFYLALWIVAFGLLDSGAEEGFGIPSDGFMMLRARARLRCEAAIRGLLIDPCWYDRSDALRELVIGYRLSVPGASDLVHQLKGNREALLRVYTQPWTLRDKPDFHDVFLFLLLSSQAVEGGDLPVDVADLAAGRIEWAIARINKEYPDQSDPWVKWAAAHLITGYSEMRGVAEICQLALAATRLRQGRLTDIQQMCADGLLGHADPDVQADALAMLAIANYRLLHTGQEELERAVALKPDAPLVREAVLVLGGAVL